MKILSAWQKPLVLPTWSGVRFMITDRTAILRALESNGRLLSHVQVSWALGPDNCKYSVVILRRLANDGLVKLFHHNQAKTWGEIQGGATESGPGAVLEWRIAVH